MMVSVPLLSLKLAAGVRPPRPQELAAGLLILKEKKSPRTICVFEPFTGSVLRTPYQDEEEQDGDNEDGNNEDDGHEDEDEHDEDYYFVPHTVYFVPYPANEVRVVQSPQY